MGYDWREAQKRGLRGWPERSWGPRPIELTEGYARGMRAVELRNSAGIELLVLADRGLDIHDLWYRGVPLSWQSGTGPVAPWRYDREGSLWMDSWQGGFLTTCGLLNAGEPSIASGRSFGLHGTVSHIPAERLAWKGPRGSSAAPGGEYSEVSGELVDRRAFGEALRLERRIRLALHDAQFSVEDRVTNEGCRPIDLLIAYHLNFGWPLVGPGSRIARSITATEAFDEASASALRSRGIASFPEPDSADEGFTLLHDVDSAAEAKASWGFALAATDGEAALAARWNADELPILGENRFFRPSDYALSLEPTNCRLRGAAWERERGTPRVLAPGESVSFKLDFHILSEAGEIDAMFRSLPR